MNKNRPVNLDLSTVRFPITAIVSITHRVAGMVSLGGILILMWMLDMSLSSAESFSFLQEVMQLPLAKIILWAVLAALGYHLVMGLRHLIMDLGYFETLEGGKLSAKIAVILAVVLIILAGVWVW